MTTEAEATRPLAIGRNGSTPYDPQPERPPMPVSEKGLPPGPRMPAIVQMFGFWYRRYAFLQQCRERYGTPYTLHMRVPAVPFVVFDDPEHIKQIFLGPPDALWAGDGSSELLKYFGPTGLAFLEEDEHIARRRLINRSTHGEAVQHVSESIAHVVERQLASWPRGEVIELFPRVHRLAIEVIRHVNFGPEPDSRLDELVDIVTEMMPFNEGLVSMVEDQFLPRPALGLLKALRPLGFKRHLELRDRADRLIYDVIADRRRAGGEPGHDMISVLLEATNEDGSPLDYQELRDEAMTNFLAGTVTTASVMTSSVEQLAREPAVRERLVAEIDSGDDDAYLTATLQEILRRRPPLPAIIPRLVMKPFEVGGVTYPRGVRLMACPSLVHHDPSIYPDPYAFRPERFLDDSPGTYTWIPFGGGRRRCLGKAIAETEIKMFLREVFRRFDVQAEDQPEDFSSHIATVRPAGGGRVTLRERSAARRQSA